jgi:hypothetical protein
MIATNAYTLAQEAAVDQFHLTAGGWIVMLLSVGFVTVLLSWCMWKVLATPGETEHLHSQADIETPDIDT